MESPECKCCKRKPEELEYYKSQAIAENTTADIIAREDGTYNPKTNQFYCFDCYIKLGMPLGTA